MSPTSAKSIFLKIDLFLSEVWNPLAQIIRGLISDALVWLSQIPLEVVYVLLAVSFILYFTHTYFNKILSWPYHFLVFFLRKIKIKKDHRKWGVVYDSKSKQPIDPAYVTVKDRMGKTVASAITDLDGRFGIILSPGSYKLVAEKTNYTFPSQRLYNKKTDGFFTGLYFGDWFYVTSNERLIDFAIPMDPVGKDWNQIEKKKKRINKIDRQEFSSAAILYFLFSGAVIFSHYIVYGYQNTINYIYGAIFIFSLIYSLLKRPSYSHSVVVDSHNNNPVSFAKIKIYNQKSKRQVASHTTSFSGQFSALVPNGTYYITVEKRDSEGQYNLAHTSSPFSVVDRSISRKFSI